MKRSWWKFGLHKPDGGDYWRFLDCPLVGWPITSRMVLWTFAIEYDNYALFVERLLKRDLFGDYFDRIY